MAKSADAFRTISEVAGWLDLPTHVLRFWESKFTQVKPVKRAGGRRYYRPNDMLLLGGIMKLLHDDGMTIKGAQKVLREQGVKFVSGLSRSLEGADDLAVEIALEKPQVVEGSASADPKHDAIEATPEVSKPLSDAAANAPAPSTSKIKLPSSPVTVEASSATDESRDAGMLSFRRAQDEEPTERPITIEPSKFEVPEAELNKDPALEPQGVESPEPVFEAPQEAAAPSSSLPSFLQSSETKDSSSEQQDTDKLTPTATPAPLSITTPDDPSDNTLEPGAGILSRLAAHNAPMSAHTRKELATAKATLKELLTD